MAFIAFIRIECVAVLHVYLECQTVFDDPLTVLPDTFVDPLVVDIKYITLPQMYLFLRCLLFHIFALSPYFISLLLVDPSDHLFAISLTIASFKPFTVSLYIGNISFTAVSASRHGARPGAILGFIHTIFL